MYATPSIRPIEVSSEAACCSSTWNCYSPAIRMECSEESYNVSVGGMVIVCLQ